MSSGRTLGRTDLVKGQEGRPGGCGDFPPGLGSTGWCGRPGQPRLLQAASHTRAHPPTPGPRARALTSALAQGYKAAGGRTVRADRADGRRGGRHPRRRTPGRRCLYLLGPAPQFPEPPGQSNPSLTPVQLGAYGGQYCAGGQESQLTAAQFQLPGLKEQAGGRRGTGVRLLASLPSGAFCHIHVAQVTTPCTPERLSPSPSRSALLTCVAPTATLPSVVPSPSHSLNFPRCYRSRGVWVRGG